MFIGKSYVILSTCYIPRNSIGFTNRISRYIMDRQNYIGFTNKSPINLLYLSIYSESIVFIFVHQQEKLHNQI